MRALAKVVCIVFVHCCAAFVSRRNGFFIARSMQRPCMRCSRLHMALDSFVMDKLSTMQRSYNAMTERMADPDVVANPELFHGISQVSGGAFSPCTRHICVQMYSFAHAVALTAGSSIDVLCSNARS